MWINSKNEIRSSNSCARFLSRIEKLLEDVPKCDALGDFDGLMKTLKSLHSKVLSEKKKAFGAKESLARRAEQLSTSNDWKTTGQALQKLQQEWKQAGHCGKEDDDRLWQRFRTAQDKFYKRRSEHFEKKDKEYTASRAKKAAIVARAEAMSSSDDWKKTGDALKKLQEEWKKAGFAGKDYEDKLWMKFRAAQDRFYERRKKHFEKLDGERERNRQKKASLIGRAESLANSTDWKLASDGLKKLQQEWKNTGPAGRDHDDKLWNTFRATQDRFYDRRSKYFASRDAENQGNLQKKQRLCSEVESLGSSSDPKSAIPRIKQLQASWKTIGHVPRDEADKLWSRFRVACDRVFENARRDREARQADWNRKMSETLARKREQLGRLEESIRHDESNVDRWQSKIYDLRPGPREYEIRSSLEQKIRDVRDKIRSKESRVAELRSSIRDIESKI